MTRAGRTGATALPDRANQLDQFAPIHPARPALNGAKSPAPKSQFREWNQADLGFQSWRQKILLSENRKLW
jgi:hypothetical protein